MNTREKIGLAADLNITNVIESFGFNPPKKRNRMKCPFCGGDNPTKFSINEKENYFYCFCCGLGGNPVQFAEAYLFGNTDPANALKAAEYLNDMFGIWTKDEELTPEQISKIQEMEKIRKKREIERKKRLKIIEKEEKLYQIHKKNEEFCKKLIYDDSIPAETVKNKIIFDCMVMQKLEFLQEKIKEEKIWKDMSS